MMRDPCLETPSGECDASEHGSIGDRPTIGGPGERDQGATPAPDAFGLLLKEIRELREYVSYYVAARADGVKLVWRNAALRALLFSLAFVTLAGLLVAAGWLVLNGCAEGLGVAFGNRPWVGAIVTGVATLAGVGLGAYCAVALRSRRSRIETIQRYEQRQTRQRSAFGHNVCDRAADVPETGK